MSDVEILGFPQSNFVWMARIACAEKGVAATLTPASPHSPEVYAINPYGKIPALRHGDFAVAETRAICAYIDRAFPGPALTPEDPKLAAKMDQWCSLAQTAIDRAIIRDYLMHYLFPDTADGKPDGAKIDAALPAMIKALDVIEQGCSTGYLVGNSFTLADAFIVPILYYAARGPESGAKVKGSPALSAYLAKMMAHPSIRDTVPPPFPGKG
jgi:glutathione S-transferase